MTIEQRTFDERQRLTALLFDCGISDRKMKALDAIIDNVAWMKIKLDDTREAIKTAGVVIAYDNGGGQKGLRENPLFKGYASLWKSYMSGMNAIFGTLPAEAMNQATEDVEQPKTVLEIIRAKHKRA